MLCGRLAYRLEKPTLSKVDLKKKRVFDVQCFEAVLCLHIAQVLSLFWFRNLNVQTYNVLKYFKRKTFCCVNFFAPLTVESLRQN